MARGCGITLATGIVPAPAVAPPVGLIVAAPPPRLLGMVMAGAP